jgi:hypothetical protein
VAHRTVWCVSGATATSRATVDCNAFNARLRGQRIEHALEAHRTVYRTCPVHHRTAQRPHLSELQRSEPNGRVTWLAHRTVSGAPCDSSLHQTASLVGGAIVTRESDTCVHLSSCAWIASFLSHSFVINSIVTEARDTNYVVVLAGTLCPV